MDDREIVASCFEPIAHTQFLTPRELPRFGIERCPEYARQTRITHLRLKATTRTGLVVTFPALKEKTGNLPGIPGGTPIQIEMVKCIQ